MKWEGNQFSYHRRWWITGEKRIINLSSYKTWKYPRKNYCKLKRKSTERETSTMQIPLISEPSFFLSWKRKTLPSSQSNIMSVDSWKGCSFSLTCNVPSCWKFSISHSLSTAHFLNLITSFTYKRSNASRAQFQICWAYVQSYHELTFCPKFPHSSWKFRSLKKMLAFSPRNPIWNEGVHVLKFISSGIF